MDLYKQEELTILVKEKKKYLYFLISFQVLAWLSFVLALVLSNYHNQVIFKIIFSILFTVLFVISALMLSKWWYFKKISHEYEILYKRTIKNTYRAIINEIKENVITLSDGSRVREVICLVKGENRRFLLSEIFEPDLPLNKEITLSIKFDYIVGYKDEN